MMREMTVPSQQIRPMETSIGEREGAVLGQVMAQAENTAKTTAEAEATSEGDAEGDAARQFASANQPAPSVQPGQPPLYKSHHGRQVKAIYLSRIQQHGQTNQHAQGVQPRAHKPNAVRPTPNMMPPKKHATLSSETFASLDTHELPIVREYSAGGLVFNERGEVAIIARHSRSGHLEWCLPKGHIEKGETPEETAVREVHEETGILGEIQGSIATIDYWFTGDTQRVHKLVHHYVLKQVSGELNVLGDPDHEAEDAAWVPFDDLTSVLSYPNERRIVWLYTRKYDRPSTL